MKKMIMKTFLLGIVLGTTMTFTACGNDNDENTDTTTGGVANPQQVFTGGLPKSFSGMAIQTNAKGQVLSIKSDTESVTFQYKDETTRATNTPDIVMTVADSYETLVCNLYLNKEGFISHCDEVEKRRNDAQNETWDFNYDSDGHLVKMIRTEGHETTIIKYQDGNIVEVTETTTEDPNDIELRKIYYTSSTISTPLLNKGCVMLFDATFGVDMDEMKYAYYAGLLGKATKHLPLQCVEKDEKYENNYYFTWTLNAAGLPVSFKSDYNNYTFKTYTFVW